MYRALIIFSLIAFPSIAFANAGIPMLAILWPLSMLSFIPIVIVESYMLNKITELGFRATFNLVAKSNLLSTIIGIPIAWFACFAIEMALMLFFVKIAGTESYPPDFIKALPQSLHDVLAVLLTFPWMGPWREGGHWIIPFATMLMLVPCFYASFWSERWYLNCKLPNLNKNVISSGVWQANIVSYILLFSACTIWLLINVFTHTSK